MVAKKKKHLHMYIFNIKITVLLTKAMFNLVESIVSKY